MVKRILILVLANCGSDSPGRPDGASDGASAGLPPPAISCPMPLEACEYECIEVRWDPSHCGRCFSICQDSDNCYEGECRCGQGPSCQYPSSCVNAGCLLPDKDGKRCEASGDCDLPTICIGGYCTKPGCNPEVCDGLDNDCNGLVDDPPLALARVCYDGPPGTANVGTCRFGLALCIGGRYGRCMDQGLPTEEIGIFACDGLDNDCDGCPDNFAGIDGECRPATIHNFDIIVYMDYSGSMRTYISRAIEVIEEASAFFAGNDSYHWALIGVPAPFTDRAITILQDLGSYEDFRAALVDTGPETAGGACEPQLAALWLGTRGELDLSYRQSALRVHIILSDEGGPQLCTPETEVTADLETVCEEAAAQGQVAAVITTVADQARWAEGTCLLIHLLSSRPEELEQRILDILGEACE